MGMKKQFVFIDDSGDPGLGKSATSHFIVAAVLIVDSDQLNDLVIAMNGFRAGLGWNELHELKFNSAKKSIIRNLLGFVQQFEFKAYAAVVDKTRNKTLPRLASGETLYNYVIRELLLKLELSEPVIFVDGVTDKEHVQRTRTYLRQALKQNGVEKSKISFVDSRKNVMIQLADVVAGSISRSFYKQKPDHNYYLDLLKSKIGGIYEIYP